MYKTQYSLPIVEIFGYDDKTDRFAVKISGKPIWLTGKELSLMLDKRDLHAICGINMPYIY